METLLTWDKEIFLAINGWHSPFFDAVMFLFSCKLFWAPLYMLFIYLVFREYGKKGFLVTGIAVLLIVLSDQSSVELFKETFQRLRPCHNPDLSGIVHLVNNKCGGTYGFVSSHAANTFAGGAFIMFLIGKRYQWLWYVVIPWLLLVGYSRIYLGVHYPADVIAGAALGAFLGVIMSRFTRNLLKSLED